MEFLVSDFTAFLDDKEDYNVIIEVDKDGNKKTFAAHSAVLRYCSSYFNKTIFEPDISNKSFDIMLRSCDVETKFIFELMILIDELELEELFKQSEIHLIETKAS
ncbi:hypothetical protein Glove_269g36 [Diversispora epigaea]|uniref:BTB domain-containing protein n=1 Tax=Diversispora epigaea TaxID=1348612 RepID=A0A397I4W6_9GLOM|nr:hypothetical protein Glove_269g36 [Diversispora epigaea]